MTRITIHVAGLAQAKGNHKAFPFKRKDGTIGAALTEGNKGVKGWETSIRSAAQQQAGGVFFDTAIRVAVIFYLPRPKSAPARVKLPLKKPDLDKLARCLDALTGVLWQDDSLVVDLVARKRFALEGVQPGARIVIEDAAPPEDRAYEGDLFAVLQELEA